MTERNTSSGESTPYGDDGSRAQRQRGPNRRDVLKSVGAAGAAGLVRSAAFSGGAAVAHHEFANPVFEPILADPEIVRTGSGTWYAYGTEDVWGDGNGFRTIPIVRSDDLVNWTYVGEVFGRRDTLDEDPSSGDPGWN